MRYTYTSQPHSHTLAHVPPVKSRLHHPPVQVFIDPGTHKVTKLFLDIPAHWSCVWCRTTRSSEPLDLRLKAAKYCDMLHFTSPRSLDCASRLIHRLTSARTAGGRPCSFVYRVSRASFGFSKINTSYSAEVRIRTQETRVPCTSLKVVAKPQASGLISQAQHVVPSSGADATGSHLVDLATLLVPYDLQTLS